MCRTTCFRHREPHVSWGGRRSDRRWGRQEACVRGIVIPLHNADANHDQIAGLSLLREREFERRDVGHQTAAIRRCDVFRMRRYGAAREPHRSHGTRRVFMEPAVRVVIESRTAATQVGKHAEDHPTGPLEHRVEYVR